MFCMTFSCICGKIPPQRSELMRHRIMRSLALAMLLSICLTILPGCQQSDAKYNNQISLAISPTESQPKDPTRFQPDVKLLV